jgi:hypothetical protein
MHRGGSRWADQAEADEALLRSLPRRPGERSAGPGDGGAGGALRFSDAFRKLELAGKPSAQGGKQRKQAQTSWPQDMSQARDKGAGAPALYADG